MDRKIARIELDESIIEGCFIRLYDEAGNNFTMYTIPIETMAFLYDKLHGLENSRPRQLAYDILDKYGLPFKVKRIQISRHDEYVFGAKVSIEDKRGLHYETMIPSDALVLLYLTGRSIRDNVVYVDDDLFEPKEELTRTIAMMPILQKLFGCPQTSKNESKDEDKDKVKQYRV